MRYPLSFDLEIAARTVWAEARGEGDDGQRAVAYSIVNRHDAGKWYSGTCLADCCTMHHKGNKYGQFSSFNVDDPNWKALFCCPDDDATLIMCRGYVQGAMLGSYADPTDGATHYANLNICNPSWITNAIKTKTIGSHTFFKNVL